MSDIAIRAEGLSKQYRIGERQKYKALRDTLTDALYSPFRRLQSAFASSKDEGKKDTRTIWALKDVSVEIKQGEVVGVIGRNGAGKSTLLKILSRITEPTEGFVDLHGRVGSLLEVGTGFHPELTGRENVYLNGSIIGMKKREIDRKFDEIVAFAEIEKFLDTPVKYYSSGMYMRLAFSVAAHLEPEILLVDEVLAVGDAAFQKKCLGKMGSVAKEGRTVVFVSHNMPVVRSLCQRCVLFEKGQLVLSGTADECAAYYLDSSMSAKLLASANFTKPSSGSPWVKSITIFSNGAPSATLCMGDKLAIAVQFVSDCPIQNPRLGFVVSTQESERVLCASNRFQASPSYSAPVYEGTICCDLGVVPLMANRYAVSLYLGDRLDDSHTIENAIAFEVVEYDCWGQGKLPPAGASHLWWPTKFEFVSPSEGTDR
jgi:lipopolysaccharide transport system ATP-binding protein